MYLYNLVAWTSILSFTLALLVPSGAADNVAFTVTSGYSNPPYVGFRTVVTSVGADLIQDLGTFRATTSGVYFFSFTALSAKNKSLKISMRKNRRPLVTGFSDDVGFKSFTLNCVVKMNPGDVLYNFVEDGAIYESTAAFRAFTSFSGYKLFETEGSGFLGGLLGRALGKQSQIAQNNNETTSADGLSKEDDFFENSDLFDLEADKNDHIFERLNEIDAD